MPERHCTRLSGCNLVVLSRPQLLLLSAGAGGSRHHVMGVI